jgi:hypothetical protein
MTSSTSWGDKQTVVRSFQVPFVAIGSCVRPLLGLGTGRGYEACSSWRERRGSGWPRRWGEPVGESSAASAIRLGGQGDWQRPRLGGRREAGQP